MPDINDIIPPVPQQEGINQYIETEAGQIKQDLYDLKYRDSTFQGHMEIDGSADISGALNVDGSIDADVISGSSFVCGSNAIFGADVSIDANLIVDGSVLFSTGSVDFSSDVTVTFAGEVTLSGGASFGGTDTSEDGDTNDLADSTLYCCTQTDGFISIIAERTGDPPHILLFMDDVSTDVTAAVNYRAAGGGYGANNSLGVQMFIPRNTFWVADCSNCNLNKIVWIPFGTGSVCAC